MAREVYVPLGETGNTSLYFRRRNIVGLYWRGDTSAYEAYNPANIALYGASAGSPIPYNALVEDGVTGDYFGDDPTSGAGVWVIYEQAGASPAEADIAIANGEISDKAGYKLASDGLDLIAATEPIGRPTTFAGWVMWLIQRFRRSTKSATEIVVMSEAGDTVTTQAITASGSNQDLGPPV